MSFKVGDQPVPGYRLEAPLGAGSYGQVWRAVGPGGVPCALKFLRLDSQTGPKEFRSIGLVKRLQHPNLCPVQAIWLRDDDGNVMAEGDEGESVTIRLQGSTELIIAMGLGQKTLAQRLTECRGGIPPRELIRYVHDAARGIDYLNEPVHDLGYGPVPIIHCDIKPANLLIVGRGVQVCDYGVAKALSKDVRKSFTAGTPAYSAPELLNSEPCQSTDQYALAITYYELRTGRLPFDEIRALAANMTGGLDLSLLDRDEQNVIRRATSVQPAKRYPTCEEMVEELVVAIGHSQSSTDLARSGGIGFPGPRRTPIPESDVPILLQTPTGPAAEVWTPQAGASVPIIPAPPQPGSPYATITGNAYSTPAATPTPPRTLGDEPYRKFAPPAKPKKKSKALLPVAIGIGLFVVIGGGVAALVFLPKTEGDGSKATPLADGGGIAPPIVPKNPGPLPTDQLAEARGWLNRPDPDVTKGLNALSLVPAAHPDRAVAEALRKAWEAADKSDGFVAYARQPVADVRNGTDADRDSLAAFRRQQLGAKVRAAVAGPVPKTAEDWRGWLDALRDADGTDAVIAALRTECWAELKDGKVDPGARPASPGSLPPTDLLTDYCKYTVARRQQVEGLSDAAARAAAVAVVPLASLDPTARPAWLGPERTRHVGDILFAASLAPGIRNPDDADHLAMPYADADAAAAWLATARGLCDPARRPEIDHALLLAWWAGNDAKRTDAMTRELADTVVTATWKDALPPAAAVRLWTIHARTRDESERGRAQAVVSFGKALGVADGNRKDVPTSYLLPEVVDPLKKLEVPSGEPAAELAKVLGRTARRVRTDRAAWVAALARSKRKPLDLATELYGRAAVVGGRAEDYGWHGLCRVEAGTLTEADLKPDIDGMEKAVDKSAPAGLALRGIVAHLRGKERSDRTAALTAHELFLTGLEACEGKEALTDEYAVLFRWSTVNAAEIVPAPVPGPPAPTASEKVTPAEGWYWLGRVEKARSEIDRKTHPRASAATFDDRAVDFLKRAWDDGRNGRWAEPIAREYGDLLVAAGMRAANRDRGKTAADRFSATDALTGADSPLSPTRKAWLSASKLVRDKPAWGALDRVISGGLETAKPEDREIVVRLHLLRAWTYFGVYGVKLPEDGKPAIETGLAFARETEKLARPPEGLPDDLVAEVRGLLGLYLFLKEDDAGVKAALTEAVRLAPAHDLAFAWKFYLSQSIWELAKKAVADDKPGEQALAYALSLEALATARTGDLQDKSPVGMFRNALRKDDYAEGQQGGMKKTVEKLPDPRRATLLALTDLVMKTWAAGRPLSKSDRERAEAIGKDVEMSRLRADVIEVLQRLGKWLRADPGEA